MNVSVSINFGPTSMVDILSSAASRDDQ